MQCYEDHVSSCNFNARITSLPVLVGVVHHTMVTPTVAASCLYDRHVPWIM